MEQTGWGGADAANAAKPAARYAWIGALRLLLTGMMPPCRTIAAKRQFATAAFDHALRPPDLG